MSDLGFEQKVEGLQVYAQHLIEIDPQNQDHIDIANLAFFYGPGKIVSYHIGNALKCVLGNIESHGSHEYSNRGLDTTDLREDTEELRHERADLLSVTTGPLTPEVREERAERISAVLAEIVSGQTLSLVKFDAFNEWYEKPVEVTADPERPLFTVFRNSHISSRDLTLQYEPRSLSYHYTGNPEEEAITFDITQLFHPTNPLILKPITAEAA